MCGWASSGAGPGARPAAPGDTDPPLTGNPSARARAAEHRTKCHCSHQSPSRRQSRVLDPTSQEGLQPPHRCGRLCRCRAGVCDPRAPRGSRAGSAERRRGAAAACRKQHGQQLPACKRSQGAVERTGGGRGSGSVPPVLQPGRGGSHQSCRLQTNHRASCREENNPHGCQNFK